MNPLKWLYIVALVATSVASPVLAQSRSGANDKGRPAGVNKIRPGLGDDPGDPEVSPWLPPGVEIDGPITGVDAEEQECEGKSMTVGSGRSVQVCAAFCFNPEDARWTPTYDANGEPTGRFEFARGFTLISEYQDGQNGLLVERVRINQPLPFCAAGGGEDEEEEREKFIVQLNMYCLNAKKSPSFDRLQYRAAGVTQDEDLQELLAILDRKQITTQEHKDLVQDAIWEITEKEGLKPQTRANLQLLPNKA
ncbi:hypothetical protein IC614_04625 [Allosphingosinicella flava]|uniref:Uncharacterized protein n=1 Tax=Allosphingosinicella flava TaxID=2771430 RepID=A0A7T2GL53_9SPHN|nr:hypothetical protein [Sphingosinicella flava]QPQ55874.1 hypothetical protein IC614_04625 [Sphingosinicella flava]